MKNNILLIILILTVLAGSRQSVFSQSELNAEDDTTTIHQENMVQIQASDSLPSLQRDIFSEPEEWERRLDEVMTSWVLKAHAQKSEHPAYQQSHSVSDEVYIERLSKLHNIIELPFNDVIRGFIDMYVDRRRSTVENMLGLEHFYFPMIEQALDRYDMPDELKYMAVIESALNPVAVSRMGATGLWQFMLPTGKEYGLEINSLIDERRDPVKATDAACRYLKTMYEVYGDWTLAIASYNCGAGNVNTAIRKAGGKKDYWAIYPYLPKETRSYVPLFIAATYVMNYYPYHQLYPVEMSMPLHTDTVMVTKQVHFEQIADILNVDIETLRGLNPQYKKDVIPGHIMPRCLRLPALDAYAFAQYEDSIANHQVDNYFTARTYAGNYSGSSKNEKITHKVKSGETLAKIASHYGVTMSNIRKWNGLKSNKVSTGRNLVIYADNGGYVKPTTASSTASTTPVSTNTAKKTSSSSTNTYATYTVKKGDTLSVIAQKHKTTYKKLMSINGLKSTQLKVGQKLKVPKA